MPGKILVGAQWGDEGKGKFEDILVKNWADLQVGVNGGNNSGRTVVFDGEKYIFHSLSPALLHGVRSLIAAGTVNDPVVLYNDIQELRERGVKVYPRYIGIDPRSHVIMPYHVEMDKARERLRAKDGKKIGTTSRGIGPCYEDRKNRSGIRFGDFVRPDVFEERFERLFRERSENLRRITGRSLEELLGKTYTEVFDEYRGIASFLGQYQTDVSREVYDALNQGKNVLFQMKQGAGLDNDFGTYHYCTSSNTISGAVFSGVGLAPQSDFEVIGVAKAYATKVGPGPFPSEINGGIEEYIRERGGEYGATTGRPRRVGWLDMPQLRLSRRLNGFGNLKLVKLDVLAGLDEIRVVDAYELGGKILTEPPILAEDYLRVRPIYKSFDGFERDISGLRNYNELPGSAQELIRYIEDDLGVFISSISTGAERDDCINRLWIERYSNRS